MSTKRISRSLPGNESPTSGTTRLRSRFAINRAKVDLHYQRSDCRSVNQLNIILHLLQDEFSNVSVAEETDDCVEAAMALIRELEMIRDKKSILEIQEAKVITDLLIP